MKDLDTMEMPAFQPQYSDGYCAQKLIILNKHGLHARPSAKIFEKILMPHGENLELHFDIAGRDSLQIQSVFDLMSLGLEQGAHLEVRIKYHGNDSDIPKIESDITAQLHELFLSFCED